MSPSTVEHLRPLCCCPSDTLQQSWRGTCWTVGGLLQQDELRCTASLLQLPERATPEIVLTQACPEGHWGEWPLLAEVRNYTHIHQGFSFFYLYLAKRCSLTYPDFWLTVSGLCSWFPSIFFQPSTTNNFLFLFLKGSIKLSQRI